MLSVIKHKRSLCREIVGEANFSSSQMSKGKLACTLPWREIVGTAKFKEDFLKVVDFVHYLKAEGYDMVTFDKVEDSSLLLVSDT